MNLKPLLWLLIWLLKELCMEMLKEQNTVVKQEQMAVKLLVVNKVIQNYK